MRPCPTALFVALSIAAGATAAEPWADPKLPVADGLELWLDAGRQAAAAKALGKPAPADAAGLEAWYDASGTGRHVRQADAAARPKLLRVGETAIVRFDGEDDALRLEKAGGELRSFTIFAVLVPRSNPGAFRAFLAFNAPGKRDYQSGVTLDMGPYPGPQFAVLNVEGRGFEGFRSLLKAPSPFGRLHTLEVRSDIDAKTVRLFVDGAFSGERPREPLPLSADEVTVGARYYTNEPGPQQVRGFGRSDVAEVLVFGRALADDEAKQVRDYLAAKHAFLKQNLPPDADGKSEPLKPVPDPPPAQVFLPGFTVRELPVDLTNVNNLRYRPDGALVALAYDGNVWLLRDTDGDGREDKAELFWDNQGRLRGPIGMALTPPGYKHGDGLFVASKGKCSLIADTNGDGKADKETVIAEGWKELPHGVDALGVAFDGRDGSVCFGLGTTDFTNAYLVGKDGKAAYSLKDERGTVMRVAPDFKSREVVATGIRFPVGLAFNRAGDLFCTDQEGATWLANGNPLDELLHVQKGRHYGFPPRHPKHLPGVIDEPSVFDYGPQHQSTCGLVFNEPVTEGGPTFGPKDWAGDAIVTGYSRGKLYRTKLVKTPAGYVGQTQLIACLSMLPADACVAPDGSLVVACHGGGPDWGSGPTGKGKLYKITYADRDHPQPVFAWPAGPREVRVEFDRPVDPARLRDAARQAKVTAGRYVRAGDRFESLWPGYAVVQAQKVAPRHDVAVRSAQLTPDRRTLILATDPHPAAVHFAVTLPGMGRPAKGAPPKGTLPQHPEIDLDFDLSGCEATWKPEGGGPAWVGWLPHSDLEVSRRLTSGSAPHDALWEAMKKPGTLTIKAQLNLTDMLRPAVQPGSRIDYEWPPETVTVWFESSASVVAHSPDSGRLRAEMNGGRTKGSVAFNPKPGRTVPVEITLTCRNNPATFSLWYAADEDKRERAFPLHRVIVPWADARPGAAEKPAELVKAPELDGGSWARGRKLFFGEQAACSKCHAVHGQGGGVGPDLSNLVHRDYASVLRDVTEPGFAINPDFVTYTVELTSGRVLTGTVRTVGGKLHVGDQAGAVTVVDRAQVESVQPSPVSTMPEGLLKQLGTEQARDLLTFLLTAGPAMPRDYPGARPAPRPRADVARVLAGSPDPPERTRPIRVVLVAGPKDHGPGEHDYPAWQNAWKELLAAGDKVEVATAWEWPAKEEFQKADVLVFYQHGTWDAARAADLDSFLERGGGLVYAHFAVDGGGDAPGFARRIGLAWQGGRSKFRHGPLEVGFNRDATHPIARNFDKLKMVDESYWDLVGSLPAGRVIATGVEGNAPRPLFWTVEPAKGRVFVSIPGHYSWTFDDPLFRVLLLRGIAWAAREPVDRFNDLVWPGADVAD